MPQDKKEISKKFKPLRKFEIKLLQNLIAKVYYFVDAEVEDPFMTQKAKIAINEALKLAKEIELYIYRETRPDEEFYLKNCQEFRILLEEISTHQLWKDHLLRKKLDLDMVAKLRAISAREEHGILSLLDFGTEEEIQKCLKKLKQLDLEEIEVSTDFEFLGKRATPCTAQADSMSQTSPI